MIIIIVVVLFMGMMGAGFFILWGKISTAISQVQTTGEAGEEASEAEAESIGPMISLDTFIVNLADKDGQRYLRVTMDLELSGEELNAEVEQRLAQIRDNILMVIPSKTFEELNSPGGKIALRNEIMTKTNELLKKEGVKNLYFTEFVIQ